MRGSIHVVPKGARSLACSAAQTLENTSVVVMVVDEAPNRREREPSILLDEQIPRGVRVSRVELRKPRLHRDSDFGTRHPT
jgi:hypothetical protein